MGGKIIRYDCYDLRKFGPTDIDNFVDIGANKGTTSLMAKILIPKARIVAFEPCKQIYEEYLLNKVKMWGIECYNIALGDGTPMCFDQRSHSGVNRFYLENKEEKKWWPDNYKYTTESKTIEGLFEDYKINRNETYILKIDCEGGERFLVRDQKKEAIEIIRGSVQTMLEIHFGFGGNFEEWSEIIKCLKDSHIMAVGQWKNKGTPDAIYEYIIHEDIPFRKGFRQIEFVNKEWFNM